MLYKALSPGPRLIFEPASISYSHGWLLRPQSMRHLLVKPPITLQICGECRDETLKHYSLISSRPSEMSRAAYNPLLVIPYEDYGTQYINYDTDTLYLAHCRQNLLKESLPNHEYCRKIKSLMIPKDRFSCVALPDGSFSISRSKCPWQHPAFYSQIILNFPNLRELFIQTNYKWSCKVEEKFQTR